jgi:membrane-associated phospholipid phosphatase
VIKLILPYSTLQVGTFWLIGWLVIFFAMNRVTSRRKSHNLHVALDDRIPFSAHTGLVYFSTYAIFVLPLILITGANSFIQVLSAYSVIIFSCCTIFILYPTRVDRREQLPNRTISHFLLNIFHSVCRPYNSFPSMHTAYACSAAFAIYRYYNPLLGGLFFFWAFAIGVSTLTSKQHVILDVAGGAVIGAIVSMFFYW